MSVDAEEVACNTMWKLTQEKKYNEIVDHVLTGCLNCITNPKKRFGGREMLFPDRPPPWITIPEAEKANPQAWKKYQKKQVHVQMTPEEFEQFLIDSDMGDEFMAHEIAKFKRVERVAAWKFVREIRKKQRELRAEREKLEKEREKKEAESRKEAERFKKADEKRKSEETKKQKNEEREEYLEKMTEEERILEQVLGEKEPEEEEEEEEEKEEEEPGKPEKVFNLKKEMPWCPSVFDMLCSEGRSVIEHTEQKRIIAMLQNLMYAGGFQHLSNKRELKDIRKASEAEYDTLVAAALEHARSEACHPIDFLTKKTMKYCLHSIRMKAPPSANFLCKSPIFSIEIGEIPSGIRSESQAIIPKVERILKKRFGADQLVIPDITKKCALNKPLPKGLPVRVTIEADPLARRLLNQCTDTSVMMDATTAAHLLAPNWESRQYDFGMRVEVHDTFAANGDRKKTVIVSKPNPFSQMSKATLQRKAMKKILKKHFVKTVSEGKPGETRKDRRAAKKEEYERVKAAEASTSTESTSSTSILDEIMSGMKKSCAVQSSSAPEATEADGGFQYAIFRVGAARMLIRSRPPLSVSQIGDKKHTTLTGKKVSFEPRVEYLPNGGAMDLGAAEWVWNYVKQVLKMSDAHVLYRTDYRIEQLLQVDSLTMNIHLSEPPPDALAILSARTMMLESLIARLETVPPGEYLAFQEHEKPLVLVAKCESDTKGAVSTDVLRITENDVQKTSDAVGDDFFHGFSPDVPLQWQIVQGRAPRMLLAKDSPLIDNLPSRNNRDKLQRQKFNMKRKFDRRQDETHHAKMAKTIDLDDPNLYADFTNPAVPFRVVERRAERGGRGRGRGFRRGGRGRGRGHKPGAPPS
ncbi:unnamed protein product [Caenorhabditis sp. 36 PRJEB53466]|nr:unnamed protein product [Caenorhabditis sp. 36 PRJEB53466]